MGKRKRGEIDCGGTSEPAMKEKYGDTVEVFALQFDSPGFYVCIGPAKKRYYLHKRILISKCPYFQKMLGSSFSSKEEENNEVTLDLPLDDEGAFHMFVEYLYVSTYNPPRSLKIAEKCLLHTHVYILADRLGLDGLKKLAIHKMTSDLTEKLDRFRWSHKSAPNLDPKSILRVVDIIYGDAFSSCTARQEPSLEEVITEGPPPVEPAMEEFATEGPAVGGDDPVETDEKETSVSSSRSQNEHPWNQMRKLIAGYSASFLNVLRQDDDFLRRILDGGEFVRDVILAANNGKEVGLPAKDEDWLSL